MAEPVKVVVDIETIPCDDEVRNILPAIKLPGNLKTECLSEWETNSLPSLKDKQYLDTALDGTFGRIACIGLLIIDGDQHDGKILCGTNENKIIAEFWKILSKYNKILFIAHNGLHFDFPFILHRSIIHGIKPTHPINLVRFRTDFVFDTMAVWANWDYKNFVKLDILAQVLNLGAKSGDGSSVFPLWQSGRYEDIATYCFDDVYLTYAIYCRMNYLSITPISSIPVSLLKLI